jgi:hypothetical protein
MLAMCNLAVAHPRLRLTLDAAVGASRSTLPDEACTPSCAAGVLPPPLKWSDLRYVFDIKEDCNGKDAIQA